eukprot:CAMPEP_0181193940 /NCGR_PEP_ID=MMETSP1096-20121128/14079_1 /TAXON_ID=156174 ORGANISM="Chrysochromulina ericina, Strain CCMP281" /NCGR_SAMPLE_ID=MMETSP1096 /ASSEMBLY_ACC=CAM_ASM_000453 /LENGTH=94 /DNA_ID=CAMNT_0023283425 /DNA_START=1679 /DNA_END=1964 /DNA_ORIENTATION=+
MSEDGRAGVASGMPDGACPLRRKECHRFDQNQAIVRKHAMKGARHKVVASSRVGPGGMANAEATEEDAGGMSSGGAGPVGDWATARMNYRRPAN